MGITAESATLLFIEWAKENRIANTKANGSLVATYLRENGLPVSWKNLNAAGQALKGRIEIVKSPEEKAAEEAARQKAEIERVRTEIYRRVSERIAPAKLKFAGDWHGVMSHLSKWLYDHRAGRLSEDTLMEAIDATKLILSWTVEPENLRKEYVHGRQNHRWNPAEEEPAAQETYKAGHRNHALDDAFNKELKEGFRRIKKGMEEEEGRHVGAVVDHAIDSYVAVRNGRVSQTQTEAVRQALRKYMAKHGSAVLSLIREMPDDATTEWYIKKRT